jgi:hypothetical protein
VKTARRIPSFYGERVDGCGANVFQPESTNQMISITNGFFKVKARIEKYDLRLRLNLADHMQKNRTISAKARDHRRVPHETIINHYLLEHFAYRQRAPCH